MVRLTLTRPAVAGVAIFCLLATCFVGVAATQPQAMPPGSPPGPQKVLTNKTTFQLPIQMDYQQRAMLREIDLYVKIGVESWQCAETALPNKDVFNYRVSQDGEYSFCVVTKDKNGRTQPSDLRNLTPALTVVVDTLKPTLDLQPWTGHAGERGVRIVITDAHADYNKLKVAYRGADQQPHPLEPVMGQEGVFRINDPEALQSTVQATATDAMGNVASQEWDLRKIMPQSAETAPPRSQKLNAASIVQSSGNGPPQPPANPPGPLPSSPDLLAPPPPAQGLADKVIESKAHKFAPEPASEGMLANGGRLIINCTRAAIDYRVDQVGLSGVGKVEVYVTNDAGQTWRKLCEDADRRSPAEIELPGEGLYGLRLVLTNGNGFGGQPPQRGDQPTSTIEVDTTSPFVQLKDIDPVVQGGNLDIRWTCSDKNLASEPISLYYATRKEGPWTPIARHIKNDGLLKWAFPHEVGPQFFLRIEAADTAGNLTRIDSPSAISLDTTEPRAQVINITPVPR